MTSLSSIDRRHLELAAKGKQAQLDYPAKTTAVTILSGLEERGLVRLVRHRDGTRTFAPTAKGRDTLSVVASERPPATWEVLADLDAAI